MTTKVEFFKTNEDDRFEYFEKFVDDVFYCETVKSKIDPWYAKPSVEIFKDMGYSLDSRRCVELENIADGDIDELYYISAAGSEEAIKWILGAMATKLNENGGKLRHVIPAYALKCFADGIISGKISKSFSKEFFAQYCEIIEKCETVTDVSIEEYEKYDYDQNYYVGVLKRPQHIIDDMLKLDKYIMVKDNALILSIVDKVVSDNSDEFEKAKVDPKLVNWLVGQCMKQGKGKISAQDFKESIIDKF